MSFILFHFSCSKDVGRVKSSLCDSLDVKYSVDIAPIMINCSTPGCHDGTSAPGNFTTYAGVKAKVDEGKMKSRVLIIKDMPPAGPLPDSLLQKLDCWIKNGAPNN